ncbi:c-type cytochrome [Pedobacter sp. LMG 31464]|uniref:C-type cytochrome n=1 Tax=Pedobacter planticolens TaxID=2679964 RepID=A0A923DX32_9SPHI|nr:c-type cytochrome [Pedobacter planticolens]MBB2145611.1 c-type cytochrome [Pedobacter planticolens]
MKKTLLFLSAITFLLAACGGSTSDSDTASTTPPPAPVESKSAMEPGELLIVKSDCVGCHHKENKLIGPAYQEIAAKYPATDENVNLLAEKIVKGGKGVWGSVPMTPHTKITNDEAKSMVKYILTLKK